LRLRAILGASLLAAFAAVPAFFAGSSSAVPAPTFTVLANYAVPAGGAEVVVFGPNPRYVAVSAAGPDKVAIVDLKDPSGPSQACELDVSSWGEPTSVAFHPSGGYVLAVVKDDPNPGTAVAFRVPDCSVVWTKSIGIGPDSVVFNRSGIAVIAIEDEELEVTNPYACPAGNVRPGYVQLLDTRPGKRLLLSNVGIDLTNVAGANCPNDPQPEAIAVSANGRYAYVTLQENNAVATIDIARKQMVAARSLGVTAHRADTTNNATADVTDANFRGRREPDGIALSRDGRYLFTADEGDTSRQDSFSPPEFSGGRTMSVVRVSDLAVVTDTGAQIEDRAAIEFNNGNTAALPQNRARNRGPEPEGVTTFAYGKSDYAVVALERSNALMVFDVTNTLAPTAVAWINVGDRPETVAYSPVRRLLISGNEVGASISVICVGGNCK
jgi:DNA-binding beta-propeller fold protein YncE